MKVILASNSPRRTEILNNILIKHEVIPSKVNEVVNNSLDPKHIAMDISKQKALDVAKDYFNDLVIGADTIVTIDGLILGKPKDKEDAIRMLSMLSGKMHKVITGVTICYKGKVTSFADITKVHFDEITNEEIEEYISCENVFDKAGSYAIQGYASRFIKRIDGNYANVVGLPSEKLVKVLKKEGYLCQITK